MIDVKKINDIDLSKYANYIIEHDFRNYYLSNPGQEHYKLLAYLSTQFDDCILLDIGTYKGCSSLALAYNTSNLVKSFDIRSGLRRISNSPDNIEYIIDNVIDTKYLDLFKKCPLILLDTDHDGPFEHEFYLYLKSINWVGTLILDDINYNQPMKEFWNSITEEKYDISEVGHHSGTGLVIFNQRTSIKYDKESYITAGPDPIHWKEHVNVKTLEEYANIIHGDILDIGCNHGATTYWLKDFNVNSITGLDINAAALEYARKLFSKISIPSKFIDLDLTTNVLDESFDTIISFHTLEHIYLEDVDNFISNIYSMLKEGGHLIIGLPYETAYYDPCHVAFYNEHSLNELMTRNSFKVVKSFKDDRWDEKNILTGIYSK